MHLVSHLPPASPTPNTYMRLVSQPTTPASQTRMHELACTRPRRLPSGVISKQCTAKSSPLPPPAQPPPGACSAAWQARSMCMRRASARKSSRPCRPGSQGAVQCMVGQAGQGICAVRQNPALMGCLLPFPCAYHCSHVPQRTKLPHTCMQPSQAHLEQKGVLLAVGAHKAQPLWPRLGC